MSVLLLNDTRVSGHAGCHATVDGVINILNKAGMEVSYSLPVGFGYSLLAEQRGDFHTNDNTLGLIRYIKSLASNKLRKKIKSGSSAIHFNATADKKLFSVKAWLRTLDELEREPGFRSLIKWSDAVVINGEGTIHHNYYGAQTLLAMAKLSKKLGKQVLLINSTIQDIDEYLISSVLSELDYISVRDEPSRSYLDGFNVKSTLSADAAFVGSYWGNDTTYLPPHIKKHDSPLCLVSAGIEFDKEGLDNLFNAVLNAGFTPAYCCFDAADNTAYRHCRDNDILVIQNTIIPWQAFPSFLSQFELCISGRHHLNILSLIAGIPFIPLPSNTWKIEGTLKTLDYPQPIVMNISELTSALRDVENLYKYDFTKNYRIAKDLAHNMLSEFRQIIHTSKHAVK